MKVFTFSPYWTRSLLSLSVPSTFLPVSRFAPWEPPSLSRRAYDRLGRVPFLPIFLLLLFIVRAGSVARDSS